MATNHSGTVLLGLLLAPLGMAALDRASVQNRLSKQARLMAELDQLGNSEADPFIKEAIGTFLIGKYDKRLAAEVRKKKGHITKLSRELQLLLLVSQTVDALGITNHYKGRLKDFYRFSFALFSGIYALTTLVGSAIFSPYYLICLPVYMVLLFFYAAFELRIASINFPGSIAEASELLRLPDGK